MYSCAARKTDEQKTTKVDVTSIVHLGTTHEQRNQDHDRHNKQHQSTDRECLIIEKPRHVGPHAQGRTTLSCGTLKGSVLLVIGSVIPTLPALLGPLQVCIDVVIRLGFIGLRILANSAHKFEHRL